MEADESTSSVEFFAKASYCEFGSKEPGGTGLHPIV